MLTVDARCSVRDCAEKDIYRMVGKCWNCHTKDILILLTAGHKAGGSYQLYECPVCGCDEVHPDRLATPDEIPAALDRIKELEAEK